MKILSGDLDHLPRMITLAKNLGYAIDDVIKDVVKNRFTLFVHKQYPEIPSEFQALPDPSADREA